MKMCLQCCGSGVEPSKIQYGHRKIYECGFCKGTGKIAEAGVTEKTDADLEEEGQLNMLEG